MTMYSATFDTSNQFVKYRLTCSLNWQSIPENRSSVRIEIQAWRTNSGYQTYGTGTATFKNYSGTNYNQAIGPSQIISQNSYTVLFSGDYYVNHNADGTASPTYGAQIAIPNIGLSSSMQYHQFTLPTIIRNAVINGITGGAKFGDSATFDLDRISSLYYWMKLKYGSTVLYEQAVSGDFSITTNKAWQSYIPNTTQMMITAELKTYTDSSMTTQIGSTSSASFTVGLSDDAYPSFTFDANSIDHNGGILSPAVPDIWGMFIQGHSGAIVTVSDAAGAYGSTITGCFISGAGNSTNGTTLTTTPIVQAGTINFTAVVTDSRGRSLTKIVSITVVAYSPPRIIDVLSQRADTVSHLAVSDGEGALVYCDYDFLSLSGNNSVSTSLKYRESGTTPWIDIEDVSFLDGVAAYIDATGGFDVAKSYEIQYLVTDALSTTTYTDLLSMARPVLEFNPAGEVGIGQEPVAGKALSVFGDVNVDGRLSIFGVDIDTNGVGSGSLTLGETSSTAYRGDHGKTAYDHSQLVTGNPHGTVGADISLKLTDAAESTTLPVTTASNVGTLIQSIRNNLKALLGYFLVGKLRIANGGTGVATIAGQSATQRKVFASPKSTILNPPAFVALDPADIGLTATATELDYVGGVTSAIQTQLDDKVGGGGVVNNITIVASLPSTPATDTIYLVG